MISLETATEMIERSRRRSVWLSPHTILLLLIGGTLGALLARPDWLTDDALGRWLWPQVVLLSFVVWIWQRARQQHKAVAMTASLWEAVQFKDWARAESLLTLLLRRPVPLPVMRMRTLMVLAAVADGQKQYAVSQHVLDSVLREPGVDRGLQFSARVAMAAALLRTHQLTDAVSLIDRLLREGLPDPLRAQVELVNLFRLVLMGQVQDAVDGAALRRALFRRHLGTRAGYGYALLAAAFDRAGQADQAGPYWRDATLLIPPAELVDKFAEIASVAVKYPASERPV